MMKPAARPPAMAPIRLLVVMIDQAEPTAPGRKPAVLEGKIHRVDPKFAS
jgi:hypothetical protein